MSARLLRESGGEFAAGVGFAEQHAGEGSATALAGVEAGDYGGDVVGPRHLDRIGRGEGDDHAVGLGEAGDQGVLAGGELQALAICAFALGAAVVGGEDQDGVGGLGCDFC